MGRSLNGTSDVMVADAAAAFANAATWSMSAWVKAAAAANKTVLSQGGAANLQQLAIEQATTTSGKLRLVLVDNTTTRLDDTAGSKTPFDGSWHHIGVTFDGSRNWVRYTDGVSDGSGTYTTGTYNAFARCGMGCLRRGGAANTQFYAGTLSHIGVWSRTLSAGEMKTLGAGALPSLLAADDYWPYLGADSPEPDLGNATKTDATLTGTAAANGGPTSKSMLRLRQ